MDDTYSCPYAPPMVLDEIAKSLGYDRLAHDLVDYIFRYNAPKVNQEGVDHPLTFEEWLSLVTPKMFDAEKLFSLLAHQTIGFNDVLRVARPALYEEWERISREYKKECDSLSK